MEVGAAVRLAQEPSDEDRMADMHVHAWMSTRAHVAACKTPSTWGKVRET